MAPRSLQKPPSGGWSGLSKNLALWAMLVLVGMFLWHVMSKQRTATTELSYTEFSRQLDAGNVATVEIFDGRTVKGFPPMFEKASEGFLIVGLCLTVLSSCESYKAREVDVVLSPLCSDSDCRANRAALRLR